MIIIAGIVASPSLISVYKNSGFEGVKLFLWDNNFRRMIGDYQGSINDPIFYLHNTAYLFLPWTIILFSGVFFQFKDFFRKRFTPADNFVFWGTWIFLLLISISKNKLPNYLLSLVPLLSVITAKSWDLIFKDKLSKLILSHKVILYIHWLLIFLVPIILFPGMSLILWLILGALFVITYLMNQSGIAENKLLLQTLLTAAAVSLILNLHIFQTLFNLQGAPVAAKIINTDISKNKKEYYLYPKDIKIRDSLISIDQNSNDRFTNVITELHFYRNYELMFYSDSPVNYIEHLNELPEIIKQPDDWIYTNEEGKNEVLKLSPPNISVTPISHFNLRRCARYINPRTRGTSFETMYLIHLENGF